jgi:hypothetical protein
MLLCGAAGAVLGRYFFGVPLVSGISIAVSGFVADRLFGYNVAVKTPSSSNSSGST